MTASKSFDRAIVMFLRLKSVAAVVQSVGEIRIEFDRFVVILDRIADLSEFMVSQAPVIVGFACVRGYLDGPIVCRYRFFEFAGAVVFDAFIKCILCFAGPGYAPERLGQGDKQQIRA